MDYIMDLINERSTWEGLLKAVTGLTGFQFADNLAAQIIALGLAAAGLWSMVVRDKIVKVKQ